MQRRKEKAFQGKSVLIMQIKIQGGNYDSFDTKKSCCFSIEVFLVTSIFKSDLLDLNLRFDILVLK